MQKGFLIMKTKINFSRMELVQALDMASRALAVKSTIAAMENYKFEVLDQNRVAITTYDMEIGIRQIVPADVLTPVSDAEAFILPVRAAQMIRAMSDDEIMLEINDNRCKVSGCFGDVNSAFTIVDAKEFPALPEVDEADTNKCVVLRTSDVVALAEGTTYACATSQVRPVHTGALFDVEAGKVTVVAVDGFRLAVRRAAEASDSADAARKMFVVPGEPLNDVAQICKQMSKKKDQDVVIVNGNRHTSMKIGNDVEIISRRLSGEFYDYKKNSPSGSDVVVSSDALHACLARAGLMLDTKMKKPLLLHINDETLQIAVQTENQQFSETLPIKSSLSHAGLRIGVNIKYLTDAVNHCDSEEIRMTVSTATSPLYFTDASVTKNESPYMEMVLPVRTK